MESLRFLMITTHFSPYRTGGDAVLVEYLSKELVKGGHEVHALSNPDVSHLLGKKRLPEEERFDGITRHQFTSRMSRLSALGSLSLGVDSAKRAWVLRLIEKIKPDVVHWHNTKGFIGRPFPSEDAVNLYTPHDYYLVCPRSNLLRPGMRLCEKPEMCQLCLAMWRRPPQLWRAGRRRLIRLPGNFRVLSPSEFVARRLSSEGIQVHSVLRNFVPDRGLVSGTPPSLRESLVYMGILEPHKGPQTLLDAFAASSESQGFNLEIVGDGSLRELLAARTRANGLSGRVRLHGYISEADLRKVLGRAAAIVLPSQWYENSPLVALEAMSMGIPVLGSNLGGLPEILKPEYGGAVFEGGDSRSIALSISKLWDQRGTLDERSARARRAYEQHFSPGVYLRRYLEEVGKA